MYDYSMLDIHRRGDFNDSVLFCEKIPAVYISHQDVAQFKHSSVNNLLLNKRNHRRVHRRLERQRLVFVRSFI